MREVHAADGGQDADADSDTDTDIDSHLARSHTPSLEDLDAADAHRMDDHFVRLDGEVRVPACTHSSFRSTHMGREHSLNIAIQHPEYVHISPSGAGLTVECPVSSVVCHQLVRPCCFSATKTKCRPRAVGERKRE
ncbi:hypothetical protein B0H14DRAFT_2867499 [Mycena olivaceomarginata]|nr:hypothetical protein B0H14DRAFT_2867499 [Mycena olivaceomarginata]